MKKAIDTVTQLGTDPIGRLILRFSVPSIVALLVTAIYNIVDRIFVGHYVGEIALGGLIASFPYMMILAAVGTLFTIGGSALISIQFGEQKHDEAQSIFGAMITLIILSSIVLTIMGIVFVRPILKLMGTTETILPYAESYMRVILIGLFFQLSSLAMASLARIEGKPKLSMASQMISGVSNIILDYIFIVPLHWGVFGAALATIIGQFIGFAILFWFFFLSGKSILRFTVRHLFVKFTTAKQICAIGPSGFFMQIGGSITFAFFLTYLGKYGGDPAISAMGAATGLATLAFMPLLGLQQGLGPIIGYNHGMKRHDRVRRTLALGIIWGIILAAIASLFVEIFPQLSASLFINSDSPTMAICIRAIRICFIMVPLLSIYTISSGYFQSTAQPLKAFVLSICRQPLFMVPCLLIIPLVLGLDGVWLSMTVSDFLAILLAIILLIHSGAMIKSHEDEQLKIPLTAPVLET